VRLLSTAAAMLNAEIATKPIIVVVNVFMAAM